MNFEETSPETMEEAIETIVRSLSNEECQTIVASDPVEFHHTVGRSMRNGWRLWEETSPLRIHFAKRFDLSHADDISGIIMEGTFAMVKGWDFHPEISAARYQEHWERYRNV